MNCWTAYPTAEIIVHGHYSPIGFNTGHKIKLFNSHIGH